MRCFCLQWGVDFLFLFFSSCILFSVYVSMYSVFLLNNVHICKLVFNGIVSACIWFSQFPFKTVSARFSNCPVNSSLCWFCNILPFTGQNRPHCLLLLVEHAWTHLVFYFLCVVMDPERLWHHVWSFYFLVIWSKDKFFTDECSLWIMRILPSGIRFLFIVYKKGEKII